MAIPIMLQGLTKRYGSTPAVEDLSLRIEPGERFFLVGPSGCGKTTLLRLIAGLVEPTAGAVWFGDRDVTRLAPNKRNIGMVFQSYALWPHMTVRQNVAFGLASRKVPRAQRRRRAEEALQRVEMAEFADRKPGALSGGQQQRVALARALAASPDVLLFDEPLSNLDARLRDQMRREIREICEASGATTVYVTHDQDEALSMAQRVGVMRDGRLVQTGSPREVYERPRSRFVASFLGETNELSARIASAEGEQITVETDAGPLMTNAETGSERKKQNGLICCIRPEAIRPAEQGASRNVFEARCVETVFLGETAERMLELPGGRRLKMRELSRGRGEAIEGERMRLFVDPADIVLLDQSETEGTAERDGRH